MNWRALVTSVMVTSVILLRGASACPSGGGIQAGAPNLLSRAGHAIGTGNGLSVKSLVLTGTVVGSADAWYGGRPSRHSPSEPAEIEIRMLLPDRYARIERDSAFTSLCGVSGNDLLIDWKAVEAGASRPRAVPPGQLEAERRAFARLALALLAETRTLLELVPRLDVKDGPGPRIEMTGGDGFKAVLELDAQSHLPTSVRWEDEVTFSRVQSQSVRDGVRRTTRKLEAARCELTLSLEDHRDVAGIRLPHRLRTTARGVVLEEITISKVVVNPPLAAGDFERALEFRQRL